MSENYYQHADHFVRVLNEKEKNQPLKTVNEEPQTIKEQPKPTVVKEIVKS